jgi:hypothetical protein
MCKSTLFYQYQPTCQDHPCSFQYLLDSYTNYFNLVNSAYYCPLGLLPSEQGALLVIGPLLIAGLRLFEVKQAPYFY